MSDWFVELKLTVREIARQPHKWGWTDCVCQAARGAEVKSGVDYMAEFRGKYSSYEEALELVRSQGYNEPIDIVAERFREINPIDAGNGDVAAVEGADGTIAFGLFIGDKVFVQTERGLGRLPRSKALRAFEVPIWQSPSLQQSQPPSHP